MNYTPLGYVLYGYGIAFVAGAYVIGSGWRTFIGALLLVIGANILGARSKP